jgi:hypothetical protein
LEQFLSRLKTRLYFESAIRGGARVAGTATPNKEARLGKWKPRIVRKGLFAIHQHL